MTTRTLRRWLLLVVVVGAVTRVGMAAWIAHADPAAVRDVDTPGYLEPARSLVEAGRFSLSPTDPTPMYVRTPGYPVFLASILWVTDSAWAVSPVQALVSLLSVAAIVLVAWRLVGPTAALVAGAIVIVDPLQLVAAGTMMTESVTTVVLAAITAVGAVALATRRPADVPAPALLALGALAAVAALLRPTYWLYPVLLAVLLAARFRRLPRRLVVARLAVFALPVIALVGGWQLRNHHAVDSWQLSGASGYNMYCQNAAYTEARATGTDIDTVRTRLGCPLSRPEARDASAFGACTATTGSGCLMPDPSAPGQGFDAWGREGLEIMRDHPGQAAAVVGGGFLRQVAGPGDATVGIYFGAEPSLPLAGSLGLWNATLWVFAGVGAVVGLRSRYRLFWAFVITTIGYTLVVSSGAFAYARFRTPVVPLLALLAALGLRHVWRQVTARSTSAPVRSGDDVAVDEWGRLLSTSRRAGSVSSAPSAS